MNDSIVRRWVALPWQRLPDADHGKPAEGAAPVDADPSNADASNTGTTDTGALDASAPARGQNMPLTNEESAALLIEAAPRLARASEADLALFAETLGGYPLGLLLAARGIDQRLLVQVKGYCGDIEKAAHALPPTLHRWVQDQNFPQAGSFAAAFLLNVQQLEKGKAAKLSRHILAAIAYCSPSGPLPQSLLMTIGGLRGSFDETGQALRRLIDLGLLQKGDQDYGMHECIAELCQALDEGNEGLALLAEALIKMQPGATRNEWVQAEKNLPPSLLFHVQHAVEHTEQAVRDEAGPLWNMAGLLHWSLENLAQARTCFERGLAYTEKTFGLLNPDAFRLSGHLGRVCSELGDLPASKRYFEQALSIGETVYAREYTGLADEATGLGLVLVESGDMNSAAKMFERALKIHEKAYGFGPRHAATAADLHNLGRTMREMDRLPEAQSYFERSLEIRQWVYGKKSAEVLEDMRMLGRVLRGQNKREEALACYEHLAVLEEKHSSVPGQPTADTLNYMGILLQDLGRLEEARRHFEQALEVDLRQHGESHPNIARDRNNIGCVLRDLGDLRGAEQCFRAAMEIVEQQFGTEHRDVAVHANNLGRVLYSLGDLQGARSCFLRVLAVDVIHLGPDQPEIATDAGNLGVVFEELGDEENARLHFERALAILEKYYAPNHPKTVSARKALERLRAV
jgi:tetratricopeptide (TPR) repeat protein